MILLVFGYLGEVGYLNGWLAFTFTFTFTIVMAGWFYIVWAIFAGDAQANLSNVSEGV